MQEERNALFMQQFEKLLDDTIITPTDDYNAKIKPINDLVRSNMPKSLFRYRAFDENSIDAFWRDIIFHSQPKNFNDPHDCLVFVDEKPLIEIIKESFSKQSMESTLKDYQNSDQMPNSIFYQFKENYPEVHMKIKNFSGKSIEEFNKNFGIDSNKLQIKADYIIMKMEKTIKDMYVQFRTRPKIACFCEDIDSTLMWAHYANHHKGFALEYDFSKVQSQCHDCKNPCAFLSLINLYPIIYRKKRYDATNWAIWLFNNDLLKNLRMDPKPEPDKLAETKANLFKGKNWEYEKEWRSIMICNRDSTNNVVRAKPQAIYLGAEASPVHQNILFNYARAKKIKIYKMKVDNSSDEFKLKYDDISY